MLALVFPAVKRGYRANWQQVVAAINNINDVKNEYEIQVLDDAVTIDGTFTIPSKAASLDFSYEQRSGAELCTLTWYGNISLPTNVTFQNIKVVEEGVSDNPIHSGNTTNLS